MLCFDFHIFYKLISSLDVAKYVMDKCVTEPKVAEKDNQGKTKKKRKDAKQKQSISLEHRWCETVRNRYEYWVCGHFTSLRGETQQRKLF